MKRHLVLITSNLVIRGIDTIIHSFESIEHSPHFVHVHVRSCPRGAHIRPLMLGAGTPAKVFAPALVLVRVRLGWRREGGELRDVKGRPRTRTHYMHTPPGTPSGSTKITAARSCPRRWVVQHLVTALELDVHASVIDAFLGVCEYIWVEK
jgi:hypothetical protein